MYSTRRIEFTMQLQDDYGREFLDLKLKFENGKIAVDIFAKPPNSFTCLLLTSCYPRENPNNIPHGIPLRLRHICNIGKKFNSKATVYKN